MVAPSLKLADSHTKDGYEHSSANIALKTASEKQDQDALCFVTVDLITSEAWHGNNCCNGDTKVPINCNHDSRLIKKPRRNTVDKCRVHAIRESNKVDNHDGNFGIEENHASQQDLMTKFASSAHNDMCTAQQPTNSTELVAHAAIKAGCAPKGKRVQWNDDHGKKLVQVFEYGWSDSGDSDSGESEEDEEDTETCACTIQ